MGYKIQIGKWYEYIPNASGDLPHSARQNNGWVASSGGAEPTYAVISATGNNLSGYVLNLQGQLEGTDMISFAHNSGTAPFHTDVSPARGYTIEACVKCISSGTSQGQNIWWYDGENQDRLIIESDGIYLTWGAGTYATDLTTDFNKFRITVKDTNINVYVNDKLRISDVFATACGYGTMGLEFGDIHGTEAWGGHCQWAYVRYRTDGAYPPNEVVKTGWTYSKFDVTEARRIQESNIIRSQNTIIPDGKMQSTKIKIDGAVFGTCYASYRDILRRFKTTLMQGTQRIYVDGIRYIEGLHNSFVIKPETQDFAKYSLALTCRYPFWQNAYPSYFKTAPVSNATFYIENNGDVEVPCKLIITGASSGTIADNIQVHNVTTDQMFKFTGSLEQTCELYIDKGFDAYNTFKLADVYGSDRWHDFEGDLLTLAVGLNRIVFTGGSVGTMEFYWREAYLS